MVVLPSFKKIVLIVNANEDPIVYEYFVVCIVDVSGLYPTMTS